MDECAVFTFFFFHSVSLGLHNLSRSSRETKTMGRLGDHLYFIQMLLLRKTKGVPTHLKTLVKKKSYSEWKHIFFGGGFVTRKTQATETLVWLENVEPSDRFLFEYYLQMLFKL